MGVLDERPIHRYKKPVYEVVLSIYSTALCGEDLQRGEPVEVSAKGEDLYALKCRTDELILSVTPCEGLCFVEMKVTKDGEYCDCDEWWCLVDLIKKTVEVVQWK